MGDTFSVSFILSCSDIYRIFYIHVKFVSSLPHYFISYMHNTGKKESKKEILKKGKTNNVTKNLLRGDSNPIPQNWLELKAIASMVFRRCCIFIRQSHGSRLSAIVRSDSICFNEMDG